MRYTIRPRQLADIFDHAFQLYCEHFLLLSGIAAVIWIPCGALMALGHLTHVETGSIVEQTYHAGIPVVQMAVMFAVANIYLGRPATITDCYEPVLPLLVRIGLTELLLLISVIIAFVMLIVPGFYVLVAWTLVPQVMMIEGRWGWDALKRSERLVKKVWWQTCGLGLIVVLMGELSADYSMVWWKAAPVVGPLATALILSVVCGYTSAVLAVYYFDRRCRMEGFDLGALEAEMSRIGAMEGGPIAAPSAFSR